MQFGVIELGVVLVMIAVVMTAALGMVSLLMDLTDPEPETAPRPWWRHWFGLT
jgi:hypothetical protein